jgi:hypothetical protein
VSDRLPDDEALRAAFAARETEPPAGACPDALRVWQAAHDELPAPERREIVAHTAACAACAAAWRLARELEPPRPLRAAAAGARPRVLAAAAALLLAASTALWLRAPVPPPEFRERSAEAITALGPDVLSRERCLLRWSPGPLGARDDVWVTSEALVPVYAARGLERSELLVPASALAAYPGGTRLRWRVERRSPQGDVVRSPAFPLRLE